MSADLVVEGLSVSYGTRVAVDDVSFRVGDNECVALIGANGAGKTSTLKALVGIEKAVAGTVTHGDQLLSGRTPRQVAQAGITLCPEGRHLFPAMSVHDNLLLGATSSGGTRQEIAALVAEMEERFPVLGQRRKQLAGTLSGGEQQMVAIARALMARPRLLILDEPTLGLAPMLVEQVLAIARSVVDSGCAVLISEQNVEATLEICDRAYVLEAGKVTASGTASELAHDPKLLAAFIGLEGAPAAL
jgi:branched-chain amino acid transport system ATP-binding protein